MTTTICRYGMKEPYKPICPPANVPPNRSALFIALSLLEGMIAGPFAAIPLTWSLLYRHAAKIDPATPLRKTARTAVLATAATGALIAAGAVFLLPMATVP